MRTAGIIKNSLIDFAGVRAYVIFTQGCNFRCLYCQNAELAKFFDSSYGEDDRLIIIFKDLKKLRKKLDGVVITGGEPTVHKDLPEFIQRIKEMGYLVKLETNGSNPSMLSQLLDMELLDYIAMDIKAPLKLEDYKELAGQCISKRTIDNIKRSIRLLKKSKIQYEVRTTLIKEKHPIESLREICNSIVGCKRFCLQQFDAEVVFDQKFNNFSAYSLSELEKMLEKIDPQVEEVMIR
ncbi:anaerobic ribonucleoside-triphosphate reductase activating protein [Bacteroidota bacterium]